MKRILSFLATLLTVVMLISAVSFAATASYCESRASEGFWTVTTTSNLNVRSGPGTSYSRCGQLPGGTIIHGTGKQSNGFLQIDTGRYDKKWVSKDYLQYTWFERGRVRVNTSGSNRLILRSGPGTKFSERTRIPNKAELSVSYRTNGWYYVQYKSGNNYYYGWVSTKYLVRVR